MPKQNVKFKKEILVLILVISLCLILGVAFLKAQTGIPQVINYHGKLKDATGNPLTGTYNFTFRLYDAETRGSLVWGPETHNGVSVTDGYFNVKLGSILPFNLDFTKPYWLSIEVNNDGEMFPKVQLTSFGYAFTAQGLYRQGADLTIQTVTSGNIILKTAGNIQLLDGNVGIGTTTPSYKLSIVDPGVGLDRPTLNNLALYTNNLERMRIDSAGNIGIGTTDITAKLQIKNLNENQATLLIQQQTSAASSFAKTVGGTDSDNGYSVQQTSDGGYIMTGSTDSFGAGDFDLFLVKFDSAGEISWARTVGGTGYDVGHSVQQTLDGGYIVAGYTNSFGAGLTDLFLVKFDSTGEISWARTVGGRGGDNGHSVQQTLDGGYIVVGSTSSFGPRGFDLFLVKFDSTGEISWTKTVGGRGWDYGHSVQQTSDGGYIMTGSTISFGARDYNLFLVKFNSAGEISWARTVGGTGYDVGHSVQQTLDGGYIVAGYTVSFGAGDSDLFLVKFNSTGEISWARTVGGTGYDVGYSTQQTLDGGYIVAGYTDSFGAGDSGFFLVKFNSTGEISWAKTVGGTDSDHGHSVQQTLDGGYIMAGSTVSFDAGDSGFFLVKFDPTGFLADSDILMSHNLSSAIPSPTVTTPSPTVDIPSPTVTTPSPTVDIPSPTVTTQAPFTILPGLLKNILYASPSGDIGINTTSPQYSLDIAGSLNLSQHLYFDSNIKLTKGASNRLDISAENLNLVSGGFQTGGTTVITSGRIVQAADGIVSAPAFSFSLDSDTGLFRPADNTIAFTTGGAERMRIDPSGSVGIGTTTPAFTLDVAGTVQMTGFKMPTGAQAGYVLTSDPTGVGTWQPSGLSWPLLAPDGTVEAPSYSFANNSNLGLFRPAINTLALTTDGVERMRIDSSGSVGIGTTAPTAKLHLKVDNLTIIPFRVNALVSGAGDWLYRKPITINNPGPVLTDFQILVTLDTRSLIEAGEMRSNCEDIRFADLNGLTQLSYWLEAGCNTVSTKIWIKVPKIPSGEKIIYVYYGNPIAPSLSNGDETFLFFDDFSTGNLNKWTILEGEWGCTGRPFYDLLPNGRQDFVAMSGSPISEGPHVIRSNIEVGSDDLIIEGYIDVKSTQYDGSFALRLADKDNFYFIGSGIGNHYFSIGKRIAGTSTELAFSGTETTGWKFVQARISGANLYGKGDSIELNTTDSDLTIGNYIGLYSSLSNGLVHFWQIKVRKYTSDEPAIINIGPAEPAPTSPSILKPVLSIQNKTGHLGIGTTRPEFKLSLEDDGGIIAKGVYGSGATLTTSGGDGTTRFIWYPKKGAFRAGGILPRRESLEWKEYKTDYFDDINIGYGSFAAGTNVIASGTNSFAFGFNTFAAADNAFIFGRECPGNLIPPQPAINDVPNSFMVHFADYYMTQPQLIVRGDGRIGMGIKNPQAGLHIFSGSIGGGILPSVIIQNYSEMGSASLSLLGDEANTYLGSGSTWIGGVEGYKKDNFLIKISGSNTPSINFLIGDQEIMRIIAGNVGIGTTAPTEKLHVIGNIYASGIKSAIVETSKGEIPLYAMESPFVWFEDFGTAKLENGQIEVKLDSIFLETISNQKPFVVYITPTSPHGSLYIASQTNHSFIVKDKDNPNSNASFNWRVVGIRKGYENLRFGLDDQGALEGFILPSEPSLIANKERAKEASVLENFLDKLKEAFLSLGLFIENGIAKVQKLIVGFIETESLKVGSPKKPTGITVYDEDTGEPYCLKVKSGQMVSIPGECGSLLSTADGSGGSDSDGGEVSVPDVCDPTYLNLCLVEADCIDAGGYWYNNTCNAEPAETPAEPEGPVCTNEHLDLCATQELCEGAKLYWYNDICNLEPEMISTPID